MNDFNLSTQKIYEKEFGIEFKGYSASEVDAFLDLIIKDYQQFETSLEQTQGKVLLLEQKNAQLKAYIVELEGKLKSYQESTNNSVSGSDILKRLSRLEELVEKKQ